MPSASTGSRNTPSGLPAASSSVRTLHAAQPSSSASKGSLRFTDANAPGVACESQPVGVESGLGLQVFVVDVNLCTSCT